MKRRIPEFNHLLEQLWKTTKHLPFALKYLSWYTLGVYELNEIDLLLDVFVWAYERSCQRYLAITQTMVEPNPLKIKYREELIQAVQGVVKGQLRPQPNVIAQVARDRVNGIDLEAFIQMLTDALNQLHEGGIARYRLRRSEYLAWQALL